ncbi:MAG TPA: patatin-like phospholipase family protein, partial [Vicinamibacterales bacterium]
SSLLLFLPTLPYVPSEPNETIGHFVAVRDVADRLLATLRTRSVGVVLSGGGFKGAYQIGVWLALRRLGANPFTTIAGTSVGALNALLIANDDPRGAIRLWKNFPGLPFTRFGVLRYLTGYTLTLGPLVIAFLAWCVGVIAVLVQAPVALIDALLAAAVIGAVTSSAALVVVYFATLSEHVFVIITPTLALWLSALVFLIAVVTLPLLSSFGLYPIRTVPGPDDPGLQEYFGCLLPFILGGIAGVMGTGVLHEAHRQSPILSNDALVATLKEHVHLSTFLHRDPVYVTTAESKFIHEPFEMNLEYDPSSRFDERPDHRVRYRISNDPGMRRAWVARYHEIALCPDDAAALNLFRVSAAIPLALPGTTGTDDQLIVDGGLADNTPILPLVVHGVQDILVLALNPRDVALGRSHEGMARYINDAYRKQRVAALSPEEAGKLYRSPRGNGSGDPKEWVPGHPNTPNVTVFVLAPGRALSMIDTPVLRFLTAR